jgi:hypothetical protein
MLLVVLFPRALVLGGPTSTYVRQALAWLAVIIIVSAPLGALHYRRAV